MSDLYLIFFAVGLALFLLVVVYSYLQQKKLNSNDYEYDSLDSIDRADKNDVSREPKTGRVDRVKRDDNELVDDTVGVSEFELDKSTDIEQDEQLGALKRAKSAFTNIKRAAQGGTSATASSDDLEPVIDDDSSSSELDETQRLGSQDLESHDLESHHPAVDDQTTKAGEGVKSEPLLDNSVDASAQTIEIPIKIARDANAVITDLVAKVLNPSSIEQSDLLSLFREHDYKFQRKVNIYGLNELTDMWRDIEFELPTARFLELGISIQLCDREGPLTEKELHDFQQMVLQFCERYDAPFEFSNDIEGVLPQAQALDQVGRRYDSMAVLNVVPKSKSGFRMADIQSCARDLMMSSDKNGIFMKTEGQKNNITVLYRLACTDGAGHFGIQATAQALATPVHDLVVYMNVPATREPEMVFQQMVQDANELATWLDGKVVDGNGKVMKQRTYAGLMQQISDIAYSMQQDGLVPGDAVAKKLF